MLTYLPILNSFAASVLRRKWIVLSDEKEKERSVTERTRAWTWILPSGFDSFGLLSTSSR
jgi:hypothetical protein